MSPSLPRSPFRRRIDPSLTPEQREARIAELRERRRKRLRWLAIRGSLTAGALTIALAVLAYWLLMTVGGRDVLLAQVQQRLPAGATFEWREAEGPASGPLTLRGVRFAYQGTVFEAERVMLDTALRPLLGRTLRLDVLEVEDATLRLAESDEPFELPRWPDVLPAIAPPLHLQAREVRIDGLRVLQAEGAAQVPVIHVDRLRGGLDARDGHLAVDRLVVDSDRGRFTADGEYAPRNDYRTDLAVTAVLPAGAGVTPPRLGLVARGDIARMDVAVAGRAPGTTRATLTLRGEDDPRWHLRAASDALDLGLLASGTPDGQPLALDLSADGVGGRAQLQGRIARGDLSAVIRPSRIALDDQVLDVQPLALELLDGTATLRGRADFRDPAARRFTFAINARGLTWGGAATTAATPAQAATDAPLIRLDADLGLAGTVEAWAAIGTADLARDGEQARVEFDGRGTGEGVALRSLRATMPGGRLDATGDVRWAPALGWDVDATLAGFDPGYFIAGWDGAIDGTLDSQGTTGDDGTLAIDVDAPRLTGRLRGRALDGRARVALALPADDARTPSYDGELALSLGRSRVEATGRIDDTLDIDARFAPLELADLLPDAAGTLRGTLALDGARTASDVQADLEGSGLRWGDMQADTLSVDGRLPWRGSGGALTLAATGLQAGLPFDTLDVDARGAVEALQLEARARGDIGALALAGSARKQGATWRGTLATLQLDPSRGAAWRLQAPTDFSWTSTPRGLAGTLEAACLAASDGGALCASADWPRRGLQLDGRGLPLALLVPYLPERDDGRPWLLSGEVAIDAQLRPAGNVWQGRATVTSAAAGLRFSERARNDILSYRNLSLEAEFDPNRITATLGADVLEDGRLDARIATGWDAYAPLDGEIAIEVDELTWMELFSPDIVEPQGRLDGRLGLSGTRGEPLLSGQAQLAGFTAEVPSLGITLQDGALALVAQPDGSARIDGRVGTGDGVLSIDGTLGWRGGDTPLVLAIRGQDVRVSDTRDLYAVASPDVEVRYTAGTPLQVTGTVGVPEARIDLERLDQGVSASPDVVVLDPVDPEDTGGLPLEMDLTLALGEDVTLNGFGLDGTLGGQLRVRAVPGREMTATGRLEVGGTYAAYGQELEITRGYLTWSNGPVSDPLLDVRAEREVAEVTAGVDISGRASAPQAEVWSDPASSQSEALAYLALGRPLSSVSGDEGRQLNAASAALTAGGSLLASQLGARIGLDDAGVMQSRALGGSVFGVGKYLSPRLYVGYGVSLLGTGQVLTLKYLLRRGFDVEIESSTVENRASLNWRLER